MYANIYGRREGHHPRLVTFWSKFESAQIRNARRRRRYLGAETNVAANWGAAHVAEDIRVIRGCRTFLSDYRHGFQIKEQE